MEQTPLQLVQVVSFILAIALFVVTMYWCKLRFRRDFAFLLGPVMYSIHVLVFYGHLIARQLGWLDFGPVTIWSAWLRFQGLATLLGVLLMVAYRRQFKR